MYPFHVLEPAWCSAAVGAVAVGVRMHVVPDAAVPCTSRNPACACNRVPCFVRAVSLAHAHTMMHRLGCDNMYQSKRKVREASRSYAFLWSQGMETAQGPCRIAGLVLRCTLPCMHRIPHILTRHRGTRHNTTLPADDGKATLALAPGPLGNGPLSRRTTAVGGHMRSPNPPKEIGKLVLLIAGYW